MTKCPCPASIGVGIMKLVILRSTRPDVLGQASGPPCSNIMGVWPNVYTKAQPRPSLVSDDGC